VLIQGVLPVAAQTPVRVAIHDVSGRKLRVLEIDASGGRFELGWDGRLANGSRAPAGVYFVRVEANGLRAQRAVVLAR
jgi:flagellar hook assembly protein FlgD